MARLTPDEKVHWKKIGGKLRDLRENIVGETRTEFAERLGVKVGTLRAYEYGSMAISRKNLERIDKIAAAALAGKPEPSPAVHGLGAAQGGPAEPAPASGADGEHEPQDFPPLGPDAPADTPRVARVVSGSRQQRIAEMYAFVALGVRLMGGDNPTTQQAAELVSATGPEAAKAWEAWAAESPKVDALLSKMGAPSAGIGVFIVHAQLTVQLILLYQSSQESDASAEPGSTDSGPLAAVA